MGWFWLLVLLAAAGVVSDATLRGAPDQQKRPELVALVGDSLAVGLERPLRAAWSPVPMTAQVKGGTTLANWLFGHEASRLLVVLNQHPTLLLVSLGTNDLANHVKPDVLAKRAAELKARAGAAGVELVWLAPGQLPWPTDELERALRATGARVITQPAGLHKSDGIHPDGKSYAAWAAAIRSEFP